MKFGVFSVCMPEYGIEQTAKLLAHLGYDGVEWRVQTMPAEEPKDVPYEQRYWGYNHSTLDWANLEEQTSLARRLCDQYKLEMIGLTSYLEPHQHEEIQRLLKAAQATGCKQVRVFPPAYQEKENYVTLFDRMRADTKILEGLARQFGVKILYEIHMDNLLASPSAAYRMLEGIDPACLGVIFDPGNMVYEGFENYRKSFELLGPYLAHVHVKNACFEQDGLDELGAIRWKRAWTPLKKGMADLGKVFSLLKEFQYQGVICVEDFSNESPTLEKLTGNLEYIHKLWERA